MNGIEKETEKDNGTLLRLEEKIACNTLRIKELETKYHEVESLYHHLESFIKKLEVPTDHSINNQPLKTESLTKILTPSKIMKEYARAF